MTRSRLFCKCQMILLTFLFTTLTLLLFGCSNVHDIKNDHGEMFSAQKASQIIKASEQKFFVLKAQDGQDDNQIYQGSGLTTSQLIESAFKPYVRLIKVGELTGPLDHKLTMAKEAGYTYVVVPKIIKWSDNYTFWTGVPDEVSLILKVYSTKTLEQVEGFVINSESSLTPKPNQKPQDLLYQPLSQVVKVMFKNKV
ncbi:DUF4823 domain-containing protein [Thiotrichales bacterium 19S9-12]|nr:DUF4823 domain-containing protein [Thiotrichales bacterium 19S9-11]MCF6812164.1 DUF4823 domain-containing protein [Thiotrichales bacterium 19S9-12]